MSFHCGIWTIIISTFLCSRDWDLGGDHLTRSNFGDKGCFLCSYYASIVTIGFTMYCSLGPTKFVSCSACATILGKGINELGH
jgi:hypothetical protein